MKTYFKYLFAISLCLSIQAHLTMIAFGYDYVNHAAHATPIEWSKQEKYHLLQFELFRHRKLIESYALDWKGKYPATPLDLDTAFTVYPKAIQGIHYEKDIPFWKTLKNPVTGSTRLKMIDFIQHNHLADDCAGKILYQPILNQQKQIVDYRLFACQEDQTLLKKKGRILLDPKFDALEPQGTFSLAYHGHIQLLQKMKPFLNVNLQDAFGVNLLMWAALNGQTKTVKWLRANGAVFNPDNRAGYKELILAASSGDLEWFKPIVENDPFSKFTCYEDGYNSVTAAAEHGNMEILEFSQSKGFDMIDTTKEGFDVLTLAAMKGHFDIVKKYFELALPEQKNKALLFAAHQGHYQIVEYLLQQAVSPNVIIRLQEYLNKAPSSFMLIDNYSALQLAASNGHTQVARLLLDNGAELNYAEHMGVTALVFAAFAGQLEMVKYLISRGAKIQLNKSTPPSVPMVEAAYKGHQQVVDYFIEELNQDPEIALSAAASAGQIKLMEHLILKGAKDFETAIQSAAQNGQFNALQILVKKLTREQLDQNNVLEKALSKSLYSGHVATIDWLLSQKIDLNMSFEREKTPLFRVSYDQNEFLVKKLLKAGADPDLTTDYGMAPLHNAAFHKNIKIAKLLLNNHANPNIIDIHNRTPLSIAVENDDFALCQLLLENGAVVDLESKYSHVVSSLRHAARKVDLTLLDLLMKYPPQNLDSGLLGAAEANNLALMDYFIERGAQINRMETISLTPIMAAASLGHFEAYNKLKTYGSDLNLKSKQGSSLLAHAIYGGNIQIIKDVLNYSSEDIQQGLGVSASQGNLQVAQMLLALGAEVNVRYDFGVTPLMLASRSQNVELVNFLLNQKANISHLTTYGQNALMYSTIKELNYTIEYQISAAGQINRKSSYYLEQKNPYNPKIYSALVNAGIDINAQDQEGRTALMIAIAAKNLTLIQLLIADKARLDIVDRKGQTAKDYAMKSDMLEIKQIFEALDIKS